VPTHGFGQQPELIWRKKILYKHFANAVAPLVFNHCPINLERQQGKSASSTRFQSASAAEHNSIAIRSRRVQNKMPQMELLPMEWSPCCPSIKK
jgi:hypothetical protein